MEAVETKSLPENAYVPLAPGEEYVPMVPASQTPPEVTWRSILWGVPLCAIFTAASAYSGLKVGQVMEAAIPIAILAIGLARMYARRSSVLENVIITTIGGAAGSVVAGAIFTLPALYTLKLNPHPVQTIFICVAGGCLGVLFLIPLRRYFVQEMHGKLPFPEATAITEVLATGEKGGSQAMLLIKASGIALVYDLIATTFNVWKEVIDFQFIPAMRTLTEKTKIALRFDAQALILGLGYVMGLRSSMILVAGGIVANYAFIPLIYMVGKHVPGLVYPGEIPIVDMAPTQIYRWYVRYIGVGAIATAGIFGIIKSLRVIAGSFSVAAKAFKGDHHVHGERTDRDLSVMTILAGVIFGAIGMAVFFGTLKPTIPVLITGLLLTLLFSFFFTSVAANAIATTARNPVSGMTMLTIIISSTVLLQFGLSGTTGMFFVMAIAGMVCTALSVSGQTITNLKTGYWLGSTPAAQEKMNLLGVVTAAITVGVTIVILAKKFQFGFAAPGDTREVLAAPQASIMQALVSGFMTRQPVPYILFFAGAIIAVSMEMLGAPALIFALGMDLPLELNTPALVGGFLSYLITRRSTRVGGESGRTLRERGVIIASGLMAGGAIGGTIGAALRIPGWYHRLIEEQRWRSWFFDNDAKSQLVSLVLFAGLCVYLWVDSTRKVATAE
jgi:putative OPT family oligopeptide transporter